MCRGLGTRTRAAGALALLVALATLAGRPPSAEAADTLRLQGGLSGIAADGASVAVSVRGGRETCDRIIVWRPGGDTTAAVSARTNCPGGSAPREGIRELALAGQRIAWIEEVAYERQRLTLRVHRLGRSTTVLVVARNHDGTARLPDGDHVGHLHASGNALAYNTWSACTQVPEDYVWQGPSCRDRGGREPSERIDGEQLWLIRPRARSVLLSGPAALALVAFGDRRLATYEGRDLRVFDLRGFEVGRVSLSPGRLQGFGLWGGLAAVLRGGRLELYSIATGDLVKALPAPPGTTLDDVEGDLAVLVGFSSVTAIRLTDGATQTFRGAGARAVAADVERAGLYLAWSSRGTSRVTFVGRRELDRLLAAKSP